MCSPTRAETPGRSGSWPGFMARRGRSRHEFVPRSWLSIAAGSAGLETQAIAWTELAIVEHDPLALWAKRMPLYDYLRAHPRFDEIMRGAG